LNVSRARRSPYRGIRASLLRSKGKKERQKKKKKKKKKNQNHNKQTGRNPNVSRACRKGGKSNEEGEKVCRKKKRKGEGNRTCVNKKDLTFSRRSLVGEKEAEASAGSGVRSTKAFRSKALSGEKKIAKE